MEIHFSFLAIVSKTLSKILTKKEEMYLKNKESLDLKLDVKSLHRVLSMINHKHIKTVDLDIKYLVLCFKDQETKHYLCEEKELEEICTAISKLGYAYEIHKTIESIMPAFFEKTIIV